MYPNELVASCYWEQETLSSSWHFYWEQEATNVTDLFVSGTRSSFLCAWSVSFLRPPKASLSQRRTGRIVTHTVIFWSVMEQSRHYPHHPEKHGVVRSTIPRNLSWLEHHHLPFLKPQFSRTGAGDFRNLTFFSDPPLRPHQFACHATRRRPGWSTSTDPPPAGEDP